MAPITQGLAMQSRLSRVSWVRADSTGRPPCDGRATARRIAAVRGLSDRLLRVIGPLPRLPAPQEVSPRSASSQARGTDGPPQRAPGAAPATQPTDEQAATSATAETQSTTQEGTASAETESLQGQTSTAQTSGPADAAARGAETSDAEGSPSASRDNDVKEGHDATSPDGPDRQPNEAAAQGASDGEEASSSVDGGQASGSCDGDEREDDPSASASASASARKGAGASSGKQAVDGASGSSKGEASSPGAAGQPSDQADGSGPSAQATAPSGGSETNAAQSGADDRLTPDGRRVDANGSGAAGAGDTIDGGDSGAAQGGAKSAQAATSQGESGGGAAPQGQATSSESGSAGAPMRQELWPRSGLPQQGTTQHVRAQDAAANGADPESSSAPGSPLAPGEVGDFWHAAGPGEREAGSVFYDARVDRHAGIIDEICATLTDIFEANRLRQPGLLRNAGSLDLRAAVDSKIGVFSGKRPRLDIFRQRAEPSQAQVDLLLVVDCSGSMHSGRGGLTRMAAARDAVAVFVEVARRQHFTLAVAAFADEAQVVKHFDDDVMGNEDAVFDTLQANGQTNNLAAINLASEMLEDARTETQVIVFITDGGAWTPREVYQRLEELKAEYPSRHYVGVGIGKGVIVDETYPNAVAVPDLDRLPIRLGEVLEIALMGGLPDAAQRRGGTRQAPSL